LQFSLKTFLFFLPFPLLLLHIQCIEASKGGVCYQETKLFWNCYREARGTPTLQFNWKKVFGFD
jgi:hypothetical protein